MKHGIWLTAALALVLLTRPAKADFTIKGAGAGSCGTWVEDRRAAPRSAELDLSWVLGFLSGIGFMGAVGDDPLNGVDADGVRAWIDNYCAAHPLINIEQAAAAFSIAHPR